uniref:Secreted protein n=1 Tax=Panagrellus redivivus TaxID=6233 RepID=A0A7E4W5H1_PANRE
MEAIFSTIKEICWIAICAKQNAFSVPARQLTLVARPDNTCKNKCTCHSSLYHKCTYLMSSNHKYLSVTPFNLA